MDLASLALPALAVLAIVEFSLGVVNAFRIGKIRAQADRGEEKLDKVLTLVPKSLRGGVDPNDAVAVREAKKLAATIDAAETESEIFAQYGEIALVAKSMLGPSWDAAMRGGPGAALRLLKPWIAKAQAAAAQNQTDRRFPTR